MLRYHAAQQSGGHVNRCIHTPARRSCRHESSFTFRSTSRPCIHGRSLGGIPRHVHHHVLLADHVGMSSRTGSYVPHVGRHGSYQVGVRGQSCGPVGRLFLRSLSAWSSQYHHYARRHHECAHVSARGALAQERVFPHRRATSHAMVHPAAHELAAWEDEFALARFLRDVTILAELVGAFARAVASGHINLETVKAWWAGMAECVINHTYAADFAEQSQPSASTDIPISQADPIEQFTSPVPIEISATHAVLQHEVWHPSPVTPPMSDRARPRSRTPPRCSRAPVASKQQSKAKNLALVD